MLPSRLPYRRLHIYLLGLMLVVLAEQVQLQGVVSQEVLSRGMLALRVYRGGGAAPRGLTQPRLHLLQPLDDGRRSLPLLLAPVWLRLLLQQQALFLRDEDVRDGHLVGAH